MKKTHASLFTGIRGFDEAADKAGWENVLHCEINDRLRQFSERINPNAKSYADITGTDFTIHRGRIYCLSGGFPCQPYSAAGKRKGKDDERHLWPHMLRAVREIQPPWVVGENVRGIINWNGGLVFNEVQADLEAEGYEVLPFLLPAAGINAPHERYRVWFVAFNAEFYAAYADCNGYGDDNRCEKTGRQKGKNKTSEEEWKRIWNFIRGNDAERPSTYAGGSGCKERHISGKSVQQAFSHRDSNDYENDWQNFPTQSPVCDGDDGLRAESLRAFVRDHSDGVLTEEEIDSIVQKAIGAGNREIIKGGGNAIVPGLALRIFNVINKYDDMIFGADARNFNTDGI